MDSTTGRKIKPCPIPNVDNPKKAIKMVWKILLVEKARGRVPRNVLMPPVKMLTPMDSSMVTVFSRRFPGHS